MNVLSRAKQGPISYLTAGQGTPFLLLHGLSTTSDSWRTAAAALATRFHVIAPDLLGFGASDLPDEDVYMEGQARAIGALLAALGIRSLYVAGHDFGGPVAITLTRLFPELEVHGVVLSSTNMFTDTPVPWPLRTAGVPVVGTIVYWLMAGSRFGLWMTYCMAVARKRSLHWRVFSRDVDARALRITQRVFQRSLANLPAHYHAVEQQLRRTQAPGLVLWGDRDPFFPLSVGRRTASSMPRAVFEVLEGVGHFGPQEHPGAYVSSILRHFAVAQPPNVQERGRET